MTSATTDGNNDHDGGNGDMMSSKKECISCEQTEEVNNITEGIDGIAIQDDMSTCANCGKKGNSDDMNMCNKCKMVKYCNAACKKKHRHKHKKACEKRVAELHDKELFKQPPPKEDCPICFLRLPTLKTGARYYACCGKEICSGCVHAPVYDDQGNVVDSEKCPFCRTPHPTTEESMERDEKRMEAGDAAAMFNLGVYHREGAYGLTQDYTKTLEYFRRASELGYAKAYTSIGIAYQYGKGVEVDTKKALHYWELGAMKGDVRARYNLGISEEKEQGNFDRALKHYMIAVKDGSLESLKNIKNMHMTGKATKEDYTKALQLYQAYLGEIKSVQRDKAAAAQGDYGDYRYY